jgi:hypothetical protein
MVCSRWAIAVGVPLGAKRMQRVRIDVDQRIGDDRCRGDARTL